MTLKCRDRPIQGYPSKMLATTTPHRVVPDIHNFWTNFATAFVLHIPHIYKSTIMEILSHTTMMSCLRMNIPFSCCLSVFLFLLAPGWSLGLYSMLTGKQAALPLHIHSPLISHHTSTLFTLTSANPR